MHTQSKFANVVVLAVMGMLLLGGITVAAAEDNAVRAIRASAATVPTNIPGIHTYAEPPKGFNPVTATDEDLATYGFPARPDKQAKPDQYAQWEQAMKAAKIRWNGELKRLPFGGRGPIQADPSRLPEAVHPETGPSVLSTSNVSGVILFNHQTTWSSTKSFNLIQATFSVPVTEFPLGSNCSQDYVNEFTFVGIDDSFAVGTNGAEVFEPGMVGGVQTAVFCNPSQTTYQAAFGWAPEALLATFNVNPGDAFYTQVIILDANDGSVFLEDLSTLTFETYAVSTCEAGVCTNLRGGDAAWTVSRGCCEGPGPNGEWPLANTTRIFFTRGLAETGGGKESYPGSQTESSTEVLNMMDDNMDQFTEGVTQGSSGVEGSGALMFATIGCASSGGCTP